MKSIVNIYQFLFIKGSYNQRLWAHIIILFAYSGLFILRHYSIEQWAIPVELKNYYQLKLSKYLMICMVGHLIFVMGVKWQSTKQLFRDFFLESGTAFNLAVFRIIFYLLLVGHFVHHMPRVEAQWALLPESSRVGLPFIGWVVHSIPINIGLFRFCCYACGILCFFIGIGLYTKVTIKLIIPFLLYCLGVPMFFGKMSHNHILLWVTLFLSFAPVSDVLSVDALLKKRRNKQPLQPPLPHAKYALPFKFIWIQLAIIYCFAGIIKLWDCGLNWAISDSMIYQIQWEWIEHYDQVPGFRIDHYPWLAKLGGIGVIYFELLYVFLIFKPKGRIWAFVGAYSFHKLAGYFMYIDFVKLRTTHFSYINWSRCASFIKTRKWKREVPGYVSDITNLTMQNFLKQKSVMATFCIGLIIVSVNFIFSMGKIHSYPFSSYPSYSAIVKNELPIIRMDAYNAEGQKINIKQVGQKNNFRWESIRPYELRIANMVENKDTAQLQSKLDEYWLLWLGSNPELSEAHEVRMYLEFTELAPEKRNIILKSDYLGRVYPQELK